MSAQAIAKLGRCADALERAAMRIGRGTGGETVAVVAIELRGLIGELADAAEGREPGDGHG